MRDGLGLELVVLYLPRLPRPPRLQRYITCGGGTDTETRARDEVAFDDEAWQLADAAAPRSSSASEASWLVANPFDPPAGSWLVVPLVSEKQLVGVVIALRLAAALARPDRRHCSPCSATCSAAGIATARLRQQLQGAEIERERMRLAAEIHDGLAQDLALGDPRARAARLRHRLPELARASSGGCGRRWRPPAAWCGPGSRTCRCTVPLGGSRPPSRR